ncbi:hypothetical protein B5S30_g3282 [[Candida] boidinii]|nr:hypothetical protein B5S30_g3282 [[Candida] boidinii]
MYSLGILIDPIHANSFYNSNLLNSVTWKPKLFSSCWNYNKILDELLVEFMENTDAIISSNYLNFERFFENYKFMDLNNSNNKFKNIIKNVNYNRKKSISNINNSNESDKNLSLASSNTTSNITTNNSNTLNSTVATNSDHMILSLFKLIDDLGPSIFTIWKLALLRKKLILYAEAPPSSVELYSSTPTSTASTGETDNKHNNGHIENPDDYDDDDDSYHPKISDFSKFVYDISLLSSVPQEIKLSLLKSGISERKLNDLEILKPIYNLCVNDIDYLKKLDEGSHFIGSTTDQIILDKSSLYDYAVKIPSHYKKPNYQPSSVTDTPQTHTSTSVSSPSSLVTADYDANADSNVDGFNNKSSKSKFPSSNSSLSSSTFVPSSGGDSVYSLSSSQSNDKLELDVPLILESKNFRNSLAKSSVKSSQRDMKRFLLLFHSIFDNFNSSKFNKKSKNIIKPSKPHYRDDISEENATLESNVEAPLLPSLTTSSSTALLNIDDSNDDDGHDFIGGGDDSADYYEASELQEQNEQLMNYYKAITEPMSIREFIWKGFSWWATAGSDGNDEDELEYDRILLGNLILKNSNGANMNEADSKIENVLLLVGYFQSLTVKIFSMLIDLINNNESAKDNGSRDKQRHQQGDESNNSLFFDSADEGEALLSHGNSANETRSHSDDTICIEHRDIYEMGLDPYSEFDVFFLTELVDLWWGKKVKIGTYLGNLCCI